ncbi:hypothetical protein OH76DRAFT_1422313 [Lentinus brumalis]|uniref:Uncharacterized protein n=1 Tax=Lentinus brumalis TaxID=2498619 RepID=A0A371CRB4_9APHY|nr:hypothetical protein OH76DRAFT_1422313 [Polyporus brumalis]
MAGFLDDIDDALNANQSPILTSNFLPSAASAARKRTRTDADLPMDEEQDPSMSNAPRAVNRNLVITAQRIAEAYKLTPSQTAEVNAFATDTFHVQNIRIFSMLLALNGNIDRLVPPPAAFTLPPDCIANIKSYAHGVIFSTKLALYKGVIPTNHLLDIVKLYRWGLPDGVENDTPKWKKVKKEAGDALTAVRRKIKIQLIASLSGEKPEDHMDIYDVAAGCVKGTDYKITVPLMARLALMRGVFSEKANQGDKFWDQVDASLVLVAQKGKGDAERISRLFKYFLDKDRKAHGTGAQPPVDESDIDNLQENIDQAIEERNRRLAVRQGQAEDEEDEEERDSPDPSPTLQNDR